MHTFKSTNSSPDRDLTKLQISRNRAIVSIIDPLGKHGGHHYHVDGTARGLTAAGHKVQVYVTKFTGAATSKRFEQRVAFGDIYGQKPALVRAVQYFAGLCRALYWAYRSQTDIVNLHAFNHDLRELTAIWGSRALGMKVILTIHDIESFGTPRSSLIRKLSLAGASAYVFQNSFSLGEFQKKSAPPSRPTVVVPHGHYCDAYPILDSRAEARKKIKLPDDEFIFLFFGNPRAEKGLDLLLQAMSILEHRSNWRLLIAGKMKAQQRRTLLETIEKMNLAGRIRIDARHIPDEETSAYYRAANAVVIPYRKIYESGVAIMAMSMARAPLVSNLEPLTEKVTHNLTGLVFQANNVTSLRDTLAEALTKDLELDALGEEAYRQVKSSRDWHKVCQSLSELADSISKCKH